MTVTRMAYEFDENERRNFEQLMGRPVALAQPVTITVTGPPLPPELAVTEREIERFIAYGGGDFARRTDRAYRDSLRPAAVRFWRGGAAQ